MKRTRPGRILVAFAFGAAIACAATLAAVRAPSAVWLEIWGAVIGSALPLAFALWFWDFQEQRRTRKKRDLYIRNVKLAIQGCSDIERETDDAARFLTIGILRSTLQRLLKLHHSFEVEDPIFQGWGLIPEIYGNGSFLKPGPNDEKPSPERLAEIRKNVSTARMAFRGMLEDIEEHRSDRI